jgi:hypothetical protein
MLNRAESIATTSHGYHSLSCSISICAHGRICSHINHSLHASSWRRQTLTHDITACGAAPRTDVGSVRSRKGTNWPRNRLFAFDAHVITWSTEVLQIAVLFVTHEIAGIQPPNTQDYRLSISNTSADRLPHELSVRNHDRTTYSNEFLCHSARLRREAGLWKQTEPRKHNYRVPKGWNDRCRVLVAEWVSG